LNKKSLTTDEKVLLLHCLDLHAPELIKTLPLLERGSVAADIVNEMRDAVGSEFTLKGLKPDDEPNNYGLKLEDLIDRLANLYIWPDRYGYK
jgi:hypothetical protein